MQNDENLALNVMSGSELCNPRQGKRARICSEETLREEEQTVQTKINELRTQYQKKKMVDGVFAYFWYDPNHHYFSQDSQLTPEHALNWPAYPGQNASWQPPPGARGMSVEMEIEMTTWGRVLMHKNTDVFAGAAGYESPWLRVINGATPPTTQPFGLPHADRKSMSNYMIVKITSAPYFIQPPSDAHDFETVCPLNNEILGTHTPVVECMVVATRPPASHQDECIPCDRAPGEILYPPEPLDSAQYVTIEIPICMLWGVMPRVPTLPLPPWILTQTLGKMARSAGPGMPGAHLGPPPLWGNVGPAGAWTQQQPFRQLVEAGESGDYAEPVVGCCYDDMDTNCSSHQGNRDACIAQPNCTWNSETSQCLQGVFGDSCANVECPSRSTRVAFSEHIYKAPGENCCRPIRSCAGMDYSTCISNYHCNWDQEDERPRCRTRECTKADCGGEAVTTSVSGTAPNCKCECKAPAVGKNYCYVADAPVAPNTANCLRRFSDRCRDRRPTDISQIEQLDDCIACVEEASADDNAAGCTDHIRGLFCSNQTCSGYSSSRCPQGQTLREQEELETTLLSDPRGCCTVSCAAARCDWDKTLKPNPETIPRSQGCCIDKTCEDADCPPDYRRKANPETISVRDGCCEPVVRSYSNKRILADCDEMHHVAVGSNQEATCNSSAMYGSDGIWSNCKWDDNVAFFNDCDRDDTAPGNNLGSVQLLPVGPLPGEDARPTGKHVWYQDLSSDYNVVNDCDDGCEPNPLGGGGVICSDSCRDKIDKYGRVCAKRSSGGAMYCLPRLWDSGDSNAESMNDYTGGILSTPN